jgi:hypothetical protein
MSIGKIIAGSLVGGTVVFIWGAVSHMVLPTGDMGIKSLPNEAVLLPQMKQAIHERGFYFFPGMGEGEMSEADETAWKDKLRAGPRGAVIFDPSGGEMMSPAQLGTELVSNILAASILALVLAKTRASRGGRVALAALLGVFAWMSIDVSYWNWYRFPTAFAAGAFIEQAVGWLLAGVVIALVLGRAQPAPAATAAIG